MKWILFFLLLPCFVKAQTTHIEDNKIVYKDTVKVEGSGKAALYNRAVKAITNNIHPVKAYKVPYYKNEDSITAVGSINLTSGYPIKKTLTYTVTLKVEDGDYSYRIDSFDIIQAKKGGKTTVIPGEEVLKDMDKSGKPSEDAEKLLNEIDMDMQKLIALVKKDMSKE